MPPPNVGATPDAAQAADAPLRAALPVPPLTPGLTAPSNNQPTLPAAEPPALADLQSNAAWQAVDTLTLPASLESTPFQRPRPSDAAAPTVLLLEPTAQPAKDSAAGPPAQAAAPAPEAEPALAAAEGPQVKRRTAERSP